MLCAMFSGRFELKADEEDGAYFIDRDGELFRYGNMQHTTSTQDLNLHKHQFFRLFNSFMFELRVKERSSFVQFALQGQIIHRVTFYILKSDVTRCIKRAINDCVTIDNEVIVIHFNYHKTNFLTSTQ